MKLFAVTTVTVDKLQSNRSSTCTGESLMIQVVALHDNVLVVGESVESVRKNKRKATVGRIVQERKV